MQKLRMVVLVLLLGWSIDASAALKIPFIFSDNAVLQRDMPIPVWGAAEAGQEVRVTFGGQSKSVAAAADGKWMLKLDPLAASDEGRTLTITAGTDTVAMKNVLVGEVWLCSGQSNMEKPLGEQRGQKPTANYQNEIAAADYPKLRLLQIPKATTSAAVTANWQLCTPASIEATHFSAIGYFFGRKLLEELHVPIGIIHSSWGGTRIEVWTSPEGFASVASLRTWADAAGARTPVKVEGIAPASLYTRMIRPLAPFAMRGTLWYQGESNSMVNDAPAYADKMRALIGGWRQLWGQGDFPFYYVQLAPYRQSRGPGIPPDALPMTWEAQTHSLAIPNTAMVVITDLVDDVNDHHPIYKKEVGERLAACALARDYGRKELVYSGPMFRGVSCKGADAVLSFDFAEGLKSRDRKTLTDFTIAGVDGHFVSAEARIDGSTVIVSSAKVPEPKYVRFGWREDAMPNLVNGAGLPASPFRTDQLPAMKAAVSAATKPVQ